MTFDELEKTAKTGDTAMVKVTRCGDVWDVAGNGFLSAHATLNGVEAHHYTPASPVKVRRVIEVAREDVASLVARVFHDEGVAQRRCGPLGEDL